MLAEVVLVVQRALVHVAVLLVRVVAAVVDFVAREAQENALVAASAFELVRLTRLADGTAFFVGAIRAILIIVALVAFRDALSVRAREFVRTARAVGATMFVRTITAVVLMITPPSIADTYTVGASKKKIYGILPSFIIYKLIRPYSFVFRRFLILG